LGSFRLPLPLFFSAACSLRNFEASAEQGRDPRTDNVILSMFKLYYNRGVPRVEELLSGSHADDKLRQKDASLPVQEWVGQTL
jgi:hypothetical protein